MSDLVPVNDPKYIHDVVITESSFKDQSMEMIKMQETILECEMNSPETSKKAYNPKVKEFQVWCKDAYRHIFIKEDFTVTGPEFYLFLKTMVCQLFLIYTKKKIRTFKILG
ncbi:uncharacterized protein EV154DRAFT_532015 [Mucor mucedo]|uniref:uncharacterized protein n=1 Tax=Mucor mucedo TaxID=29922 RepID=UPI00221E5400|nr:uncharacterized protein EV154DRAFT_532015 [Mucor mucedo]KAI7867344.1 hypothetical protein EV154DRAFT_532015 [Mucor mucedo]